MQGISADKYRELFKLRAEGKLPSMECHKSLFERIKKIYKPGMKILDVGTGVGHAYAELKKLSVDYTGTDIDPQMIKMAKEVWKDDSNAKFFVGNVNNLHLLFADNSFDIVICYNVLLHLSDFKNALKELVRVSKRYVFVRSLFGREAMEVHVPVPEGYGDVYKQLFYNRYAKNDVREFLDSLDIRIGQLKFEDDKAVIPQASVEKVSETLGVQKQEFTSGDDEWKGRKLKYQVMHLEKLPKILAMIPARKGSKRLPDKNVKMFHGKPLWKWTYDACMQSKCISGIMVTTDDERILAAVTPECAIKRPDGLCTDDASVNDAIKHVIDEEEEKGHFYDYIVMLQLTSPLRTAKDIDDLVEFALDNRYESVASAYKFRGFFRDFHDGGFDVIQGADVLNGSIYFSSIKRFKDCLKIFDNDSVLFLMPEERSIDIDMQLDWDIAEFLIKYNKKHKTVTYE